MVVLFLLIKHTMLCDVTTRASRLMLISCDFIPNGLIFVSTILYHIFMFNLDQLVRLFYCIGLLAGLTRLTSLSGSRM
jgi:hypothetical protein